jgi:hypothetical protein
MEERDLEIEFEIWEGFEHRGGTDPGMLVE